MDILFWSDSDL